MSSLDPAVVHRRVPTNGINLHVASGGPEHGPLVILLHGFPEFWYGWRHQIEPLAEAGYRVWAPDQRGYNLSEKPSRVADYALERLGEDVLGLIDAAGVKRAALVGHDWGAAVAWWTALRHPERVTTLSVLNVPHPIVFERHVLSSFSQLRKSWYMAAFQLPWLPERMLTRSNAVPFGRAIAESARPGTFDEEALRRYREAWLQPLAATSMINWYRAALRAPPKTPSDLRIRVPTSIIWGADDPVLDVQLAQMSLELCEDGHLELLEGVSHWVQHEAHDRVNALLLEHLGRREG